MCGGLVNNVAASVLTTVGTGSAPAVMPAGSSDWAAFGGFSLAQSVLPFLTASLAGDTWGLALSPASCP